MKVLHIINNLGSGGAEKLIEESLPLMNNIEGIKADVLLLTDKNNVFDKKLKKSGVKVDTIPIRNLYSPLNMYYIKEHIVKGNYDVVHAHLFPANYWTSLASKLIFKKKPKFITTEHNTHNRRREKRYLRCLEKFIYSSYDKIISISQQTQDNLISWLKPKKKSIEKFVVIENGINIKKFIEAKPYHKFEINGQFTQDTKLICMVGRFSEQKDQATLIRAMEKLPSDIHLLLIGEGPLKEKNETLAKEIGVKDRVHFLGFRNDIPRIVKTVDIVVLSSHWEGFGLAAVEGMAAGKPVIGSNVDGLREIINDGESIFSVGNSYELAEKIKNLFSDRQKYLQKVKYFNERSKIFDIKNVLVKYVESYYKLIQ